MKKRGYRDFSFKVFVSRYRKILLWNNSVYQKITIFEKIFCMRRGYHDFVSKIFVSRDRTTSYGVPSVSQKITKFLVLKKFMDKRGSEGWGCGVGREYHDFLSKIFCLTGPKILVGNPLVFH